MEPTTPKKVPFGRKLAFAVGDVFGGGSFNVINFLYPGFLALVVGLPAAWAGAVMLIARIWDAVTDPLMGILSDATSSRMGKRRIYILIAAPLALLAMFLMFFPYSFDSLWARFAAVTLSYIFFCTVSTMVMIPYYSLSSEMSADYSQRASVNALRLGFSIFSSIICVAVPGMIVDGLKTPADPLGKQGYIVMSLIFGALFAVCLLVTALGAKAEINTPPQRGRFKVKEFLRPLKLRPFRQYLGMQMCLSFAMSIMSSLFFLYINFYIMRDQYASTGSAGIVGLLGAAIMFSMQIVALPLYLKLIEKTSKTVAYRCGSLLWIATGVGMLFVQPGVQPWVIYIMAALMGLGISGPGMVPHTMFGDVNDAGEVLFGQRLEGSFSGLANFINKVAQAVGIAIVFAVLGAAGFVEQEVGAAQILTQPDSAQQMLKWVLCLAPFFFMGIGMLVSLRYKIDAKRQKQLAVMIEKQKAEGGEPTRAEREALIEEL
ncbi:MAG: MFS transporter [Eubacteriales bacterium]|nr:MFS transporter [Eubacteriales bacterium]